MQKKFLALGLLFVILGTTSFAFAQEDTQDEDSFWIGIGLNSGAALAAGGTGAVAGILLSSIKAIGLRLKDGTTTIDPKKLGLNILVGGAVGAIMVILGVPIEGTIGGQFIALYIVNQFRPLLSKWIQGQEQKPKE